MNSRTIKGMPFAKPTQEELTTFSELVRPLYEQIEVLQRESKALEDLRDVLLPKLMSGEIDVSKVDITQLNNHFQEDE